MCRVNTSPTSLKIAVSYLLSCQGLTLLVVICHMCRSGMEASKLLFPDPTGEGAESPGLNTMPLSCGAQCAEHEVDPEH